MVFSFKLYIIDTTVVFSIVEQDAEFTEFVKDSDVVTGDGMSLKSVVSPELSENVVFIRGRGDSRHSDVVYLNLTTKEEALNYVTKVLKCINMVYKKAVGKR